MKHDEDIIGYQLVDLQLVPIRKAPKGQIVTRAFILCANCGRMINSTGGPRQNALCGWPCVLEFLK